MMLPLDYEQDKLDRQSALGQDPMSRLRFLEKQFQQYPGRRPGGTGKTGLPSFDRRGYDKMLGERTEYMSLAERLKKHLASFQQ